MIRKDGWMVTSICALEMVFLELVSNELSSQKPPYQSLGQKLQRHISLPVVHERAARGARSGAGCAILEKKLNSDRPCRVIRRDAEAARCRASGGSLSAEWRSNSQPYRVTGIQFGHTSRQAEARPARENGPN
ncbi:unnamed protein product, partial [Iphiclides podalirius]